jgi:hypothetical protein
VGIDDTIAISNRCARTAMFSTACVEAFLKTLWTTRVRIFPINHLARRDEKLRSKCAYFSTTAVESIR